MRATGLETVQPKTIRRENRENPNKSLKKLKSGGSIFDANPGSDLVAIQHPNLVNLVKVRKQDLIKHFTEKDNLKHLPKLVGSQATYDSDPLLEELIELGNQICNYWGDSEAARDQMRSDILSYPPHKREALMGTLKGSLKDDRPR